MKLSRLTILILGILLLSPLGHSWAQEIAQGIEESYENRPDILTIEAEELPFYDEVWKRSLRGHIEVLAMVLEIYKDHEIYFLARDAEHFYDLARLIISSKRSGNFARFHLINVSSGNMHDPNLREYLYQQGLSDRDLEKGRKVLFFDTGLRGTIPRLITSLFPKHQEQMSTHLLTSQYFDFPSSRLFLTALDPKAHERDPMHSHSLILQYEHISRYTGRSFRFSYHGRRWHPVSYIPYGEKERKNKKMTLEEFRELAKTQGDHPPLRAKARAYMADLRFYYEKPETQELLTTRRAYWSALKEQLDKKDKQGLMEVAARLLLTTDTTEAAFNTALIKDFLELSASNLKIRDFSLPSFQDILKFSRILQEKEGKKGSSVDSVSQQQESLCLGGNGGTTPLKETEALLNQLTKGL